MKKTLAAATAIILALGLSAVGISSADAATTDTTGGSSSSSSTTTDTTSSSSGSTASDSTGSSSSGTSSTPAAPAATTPVAPAATTPAATTPAATTPVTTKAATNPYAPTPTCVAAATVTWKYTYDSATASGDITASAYGAAVGAKLCSPLSVRAATWTYDLPTSGSATTPSWPQSLEGSQYVTIDAIGTKHYVAPNVSSCRQHDIYASFNGTAALALPSKLLGSNKPYEAPFLSSTLRGSGPTPTYTVDSSVGCAKIAPVASIAHGACYWDAGQKASFETVGLTYDNSGSNVPVKFAVQSYPQNNVDNSAYNRTVAAGAVVTVPLQASWTGGVSYNVIANGVTTILSVPSFASCAPGSVDDSTIEAPAAPTSTDVCGTRNDTVVIPALTADDHYTYTTVDNRASGIGTVVVTAKPDAGYVFATDAVTTWTLPFRSDAANSCVSIAYEPSATPQTCSADATATAPVSGAITVFGTTGVIYTIHKTDAPAAADIIVAKGATKVAPGHYTVTASTLPGYLFDASVTPVTQLVVADNAIDCQLDTHAFVPPSVTWSNAGCGVGMSNGSITINPADGLDYFVNGTKLVSAVTAFAPGTYIVTVVAQPGNSIDGDDQFTAVIATPASCGDLSSSSLSSSELGTLAFTGFTGGPAFLTAAALLLLVGGAFVFAGNRRRRNDEI